MAAPKKETDISRKNGQSTPSSSRKRSRLNTPTSQHNTPAPTNIKETANGHPHSETNGNSKDQSTSTAAQKVTNGVKGPQNPFLNTLTAAHLFELSNGHAQPGTEIYEEPPSSPLSSPPASMVGDLEEYFRRPKAEPSPAKEATPTTAIDGEATANLDSSLTGLEIALEASKGHATPSKSSSRESHQASPALATTILAKVETSIDAPNGDTSQSRSSRKRSLSSADELSLPDPPIKAESSKVIARTRRKTKSNSPASNLKDDLAPKLDEVASAAGEDTISNEEPVRRSKRTKTDRLPDIEFDPDDMELPYQEASPSEIAEWDGWLEMESSPEAFTVMLQEWGIRGMKAVDVYGLDPEALVILPQPVHGLIFLYPYRDGDWGEQMEPCPDHVWFANQVDGTNACATVALMNIVNNVPNANLGSSLQSFKSDTKPMTAAERGNHLNDFHHIKAVHNSFIRINEMMEDDIAAEKDHEAREKQASIDAKKKAAAKLAAKKKKAAEKTAKKRERVAAKATAKAATEGNSTRVSPADKTGAGVTKSGAATKKKSAAKKTTSANTKKKVTTPAKPKKETPAMAKAATKKKADALARARYHYVAYLPINGEIWKLDGMDDEPLHLGACDNATWLDSVAPLIQASMADLSEDGINFSILAVVQDPLYNDTMDLAANIKTMQQVHEELAKVDSEWPLHPDAADCLGDESLDGPSDDYKVTEDMIDAATITSSDQEQILEPKGVGSLLGLKKKLTSQQKMLKSSIRLGKAEEDKRQAQVDRRRRDFGPLIQWQLMDLMDNGVLDDLLDKHDANKKDAKKGNAKAAAGKGKGKSKGRKR